MMAKNLLIDNISEPLNGVTNARIDIQARDGNLKVDRLTGGEQLLASGTLEYFESQGVPIRSLVSSTNQATLTLEEGNTGRPWFRLPWATCNGATEWQIHLNPAVSSDITTHSGGGNVRLNLAGMAVTRVSAESGGGNLDVVLPDGAVDLSVTARTGAGNVIVDIGSDIRGSNVVNARSGAGNVVVRIPSGIAARIQAATGLGKALVDPSFSLAEKDTYQSPDYDSAANKVEITVKSGAGNVSVSTR
jgi:hypothetical protein